MARLLDPKTKIVTLTVTEKGYCLDNDGNLDLSNTLIEHDLTNPSSPNSAIGLLAHAIRCRMVNDIDPFLVISCDNVTENGSKLRSAVLQFVEAGSAAELAEHIRSSMYFPCTMVDSITPATDAKLREAISNDLNYEDAWPIKREAFAQWVIEKTPTTELPAWEQSGVTFTTDIEGFENAKLRLLNLPHSCLAYVGRLLGLDTVYEAINHKPLADFVRSMVDDEVIPSCTVPEGFSLERYRDDILQRFQNPSIKHLLEQIAFDGSQKLQMRLIPVVKLNLEQGRSIDKLCLVLAAWLRFVMLKVENGDELVDPMNGRLQNIVNSGAGNPSDILKNFLADESLFDQNLAAHELFRNSLSKAFVTISDSGIDTALK